MPRNVPSIASGRKTLDERTICYKNNESELKDSIRTTKCWSNNVPLNLLFKTLDIVFTIINIAHRIHLSVNFPQIDDKCYYLGRFPSEIVFTHLSQASHFRHRLYRLMLSFILCFGHKKSCVGRYLPARSAGSEEKKKRISYLS